jgi:hypothetical protein
MSCCGQRRASLNSRTAPAATSRISSANVTRGPAASAAPSGRATDVTLRYLGPGPFSMRGPRSGRLYSFPIAGTLVRIDRQDVNALLRTRLFRRETA